MPLCWDITDTRFSKDDVQAPEFPQWVLLTLAMDVLKVVRGEYAYGFTECVLDEEVGRRLEKKYEEQAEEKPESRKFHLEMRDSVSWFIGARFNRSR